MRNWAWLKDKIEKILIGTATSLVSNGSWGLPICFSEIMMIREDWASSPEETRFAMTSQRDRFHTS